MINDEGPQWEDARIEALESVLGESDHFVDHAAIPFDQGSENGGSADVIFFRRHVHGIISVTSELIGREDQVQNDLGNYELMICHRHDDDWGADVIGQLAYYTLRARLNPGDTMDIAGAAPQGSSIAGLLFYGYASFEVKNRKCGLLLCLGITTDELEACRTGNRHTVEKRLKEASVYPFTDLFRQSVLR
jgi:hypothetical protein